LIIWYRTNKLKKILDSEKEIKTAYGPDQAKKVMARMSVLKSANNLSEVPTLPPERRHALTGQELGQFAVDIKQPYRIVFEPTIKPVPELQTGGLDLSKVTEITILEVEDYH
jgi:proteic killer suppression protein